jgi:hypothetical protein
MKKQLELPPSQEMRGELLGTVKQLAHDHFIQLEIGTDADFEKFWDEAFFANARLEAGDGRLDS